MAMSYSTSLEYLYGLHKHGIKLGLGTIEAMLARLGRPEQRWPALHVGGTNGKGSTAAMAAAVLQAAGHRVGLYTSPHLVDFRERIRVDGLPISQERVAELTERVRTAVEPVPAPTFFEFTTAMAFQHFAEMEVDVAVVEVGMGGRFDATNVVRPAVSVITNVSLDHQVHLGSTVGAIAFEKAGIIKPGVPLVVGRLAPAAAEVIEQTASERAASCHGLGSEFRTAGETPERFRYEGLRIAYEGLSCPLLGAHQLENAACALAMLELASTRGLGLTESAVRAGLAAVCWEGRLEIAECRPLLLLDGAHNQTAAEVVAAHLATYRREHPDSRVLLVIGMMCDKDREGFLRTISPVADEVILTQTAVPRAATVQELRAALPDRVDAAHAVPVPADALALARRLASPEDLICVTGSLMLVGEVKALLRGCGLSPIRG